LERRGCRGSHLLSGLGKLEVKKHGGEAEYQAKKSQRGKIKTPGGDNPNWSKDFCPWGGSEVAERSTTRKNNGRTQKKE